MGSVSIETVPLSGVEQFEEESLQLAARGFSGAVGQSRVGLVAFGESLRRRLRSLFQDWEFI